MLLSTDIVVSPCTQRSTFPGNRSSREALLPTRRGRRRKAALEAVRDNRDALEHDAALSVFGRETGQIPGEDEEFAAELHEALADEERHLSSDHFRRSLLNNSWCALALPQSPHAHDVHSLCI